MHDDPTDGQPRGSGSAPDRRETESSTSCGAGVETVGPRAPVGSQSQDKRRRRLSRGIETPPATPRTAVAAGSRAVKHARWPFFNGYGTDRVDTLPLAGRTRSYFDIFGSLGAALSGIAIDPSNVYLTFDNSGGAVVACPLPDGAHDHRERQQRANAVAPDGAHAYFLSPHGGPASFFCARTSSTCARTPVRRKSSAKCPSNSLLFAWHAPCGKARHDGHVERVSGDAWDAACGVGCAERPVDAGVRQ